MNRMQAGANLALSSTMTEVSVSWLPQNIPLGVCAFLLDNTDTAQAVIHANNSSNEFVRLIMDTDKFNFRINCSQIPPNIVKIVFVVANETSLSAYSQLNISLDNIATFSPQHEALQSLILGELYFRNQQWKFRAVGQGFQQNLETIAHRYGVNLSLSQTIANDLTRLTENIRQELPDINANLRNINVRGIIQLIKEFSLLWLFASFAIIIGLELFLAELLTPRFIGGYIPPSFKYLMEVFFLFSNFMIGGIIIGLLSPKIRLLEPALAALLCMVLLLSPNGFFTSYGYSYAYFSVWKFIFGGGFAFFLALYGAILGEKIAAKMGNQQSRDYFNQ